MSIENKSFPTILTSQNVKILKTNAKKNSRKT